MLLQDIKMKAAQQSIDEVYGENEWEVLSYENSHSPVTVKHKCGHEKTISRFSTFKSGKAKCVCNRKKKGVTTKFEDLNKRIEDLTYGTYELVSLKDSTEFIVNHKSCDRPPFKTSSMRFFTRGQRCACSKKGRVGRKPKSETVIEE